MKTTDRSSHLFFVRQVGPTSAPNEISELTSVLTTDAQQFPRGGEDDRCEFALFQTLLGRCNLRVVGSELTKLLVAKFAPSDHEGPSVNVGAASEVTKKRYLTERSKISRAS